MKLIVKESTMITPAQDLPNKHLWLSNLDVMHEKIHMPTLYLYKKSNGSCFSFEVKALKDAMSKVLVPFYPVAGRLGRDDNGRLEIYCNNKGVMFIAAETDCAIDDLGDFMRNMELLQLIPTVDNSCGISSFPLAIFQVTTFTCGGVSIGIRFHHVLGDGIAALNFINTWCDVARGAPMASPPLIDRTFLRSQDPPKPKFEHTGFLPPLTMNASSTQNPTQRQSTCFEILKITPRLLDTLKTKVNTKDGKTKYSSYLVLTAHIWRCISKARGLADDQATKLFIAVDGRARLHPPVSHNYFGNTVFPAAPVALSGELSSETLKGTVERIDREIKKMDDEYLRSAIDYLGLLDDFTPILRGPDSFRGPNLSIVSWMRLPFYEADFGMGKPVFVRSANPLPGKGYIMQTPTPDKDACWILVICLEQDYMQSFLKLFDEVSI